MRALDRALDLMDILASEQGMTLSEIAQRMGLAPSTVHRVLTTLDARAVVESDPLTQAWHLGPTAFRYGSAFMRRSGLIERSRPVMRRLMELTGETANLGIRNGNAVLFIGQVETHETIRAFFPPGTRSPLHSSGIGKALLAFVRPEVLRTFFHEAVLDRFTPTTLTERADLVADLTETRARGYSIDNEERSPGMRCIAAPIFDMFGEPVAGISVSGPSHRMTEARLSDIGSAVVEAARALSLSGPAEDNF
nr:HTH-type transcriptional regulator BhcR [Paracoccus aminophilus]